MISREASLLEIATRHVGAGQLQESHLKDLFILDAELGGSCRFEGGRLWRVASIDTIAAQGLRTGNPVDIPMKSFSCWSKDPVTLMNIARHRFTSMAPDQEFLLMRAEVPPGTGIDIEALFRSLSVTEGYSWHRYAGREREVVLRHDEPVLTIRPEMVEGLWRADEYEAIAPRVGEEFIASTDDPLVVDEVLHPENGGYVVVSGAEHYLLHWEFGELMGVRHENTPDGLDL